MTELNVFIGEHVHFVCDTGLNLMTQKLLWNFCTFISAGSNRLMIKHELTALSAVCFHQKTKGGDFILIRFIFEKKKALLCTAKTKILK